MTLLSISNFKNILVVGSLNGKQDKISKIKDLTQNYELIILNGNALSPLDSLENIKLNLEKINDLLLTKKVIYNLGSHDLKLLTTLQPNLKNIYEWINSKPNVVWLTFDRFSILVLNGGLKPNITSKNDLKDNLEISFINFIDNKPWQVYYGGWLGYVISNNPLNDEPKYFPNSRQIGTNNSDLYAQEICNSGLTKLIKL